MTDFEVLDMGTPIRLTDDCKLTNEAKARAADGHPILATIQ